MKERPILFSAPMVRAILSGQKTQTRRVVKGMALEWLQPGMFTPEYVAHPENFLCPYGLPGDRLWVREAWRVHKDADHLPPRDLPQSLTVRYEVDGMRDSECGKYRPPMFMPRWACRIVLEIVSVRVELLQDISDVDCIAEGCAGGHGAIPGYGYSATPHEHYRWIWESINGPESWGANTWVWVLEFKVSAPAEAQ